MNEQASHPVVQTAAFSSLACKTRKGGREEREGPPAFATVHSLKAFMRTSVTLAPYFQTGCCPENRASPREFALPDGLRVSSSRSFVMDCRSGHTRQALVAIDPPVQFFRHSTAEFKAQDWRMGLLMEETTLYMHSWVRRAVAPPLFT